MTARGEELVWLGKNNLYPSTSLRQSCCMKDLDLSSEKDAPEGEK